MNSWFPILIVSSFFLIGLGLSQLPQCALDKVIFIVDEQQPNSNTYYSIMDFAQGLVDRVSTGSVTLLALDSRQFQKLKFNVIFESLDITEVTPEVWQGRIKSIWTEEDLEEACVELDSETVLIGINLHYPLFAVKFIEDLLIREEAHNIPHSVGYDFRKPKLKVFEIDTNKRVEGKQTYTVFSMTAQDWVMKYALKSYRHLGAFHTSIIALEKEVCRSTTISKTTHALNLLGQEVCDPQSCWEYYEKSWNKPEVSVKVNDYTWNIQVKLISPFSFYPIRFVQFDWSEFQRTCLARSMSLLTIRSEKEAHYFARLISLYFAQIMSHFLPDNGEINVKIGLRRDRESAGQRFSWDTGKDLLFSHWAPGEPSEVSVRECVDWRFTRDNESAPWTDAGWHTSGCGDKSAHVTICEEKVAPAYHARLLTVKQDTINNDSYSEVLLKGAFGLIFLKKRFQRLQVIVFSMSAAVTSGYIYEIMKDRLEIRDSVQMSSLFSHYRDVRKAFDQLRPLFHLCDTEQAHWDESVPAVPLSQLCDGVNDCSSGSDENLCGINGYVPCLPNEFTCTSKQCVPMDAKCDLVKDCQDGSDETDCDLECPHRECFSGRCLPKSRFHDGFEDCDDGSDETGNPSTREACVFVCNRTECVTREMLNDSKVDCVGSEGPLDETLGALEWINCSQNGNAAIINNQAPKCVLVRDRFKEVIGCRNYEHLQGCADFFCPVDFVKCPGSFCIPLSYVHDDNEDCDEGEDEANDPGINFTNLFLCNAMERQLVPMLALCDGKKDCVRGEDELDCGVRCPSGFICLAGAVKTFTYNKTWPPLQDLSFIDPRIRYLELSGVSIPNFFNIYPQAHLKYLRTLKLHSSDINSIIFHSPDSLNRNISNSSKCRLNIRNADFFLVRLADLSYNKLTEIPECSFLRVSFFLQTLNLSHNYQLTHVHQMSFIALRDLEVLDLSFTGISWLEKYLFRGANKLKTLSLKNTGLTVINFILPRSVMRLNFEETSVADISLEAFREIKSLQELWSPTYKLCCPVVLGPHIQSHVCHFSGDAMSSCTDLIKETPLRVTLWLVSLAILAGNIITLLYRLTWERALLHKPYGLFVTNLGVSDLIMGAYLMVVAVADVIFKNVYVLHDYKWRHSHVCWVAGVLVTLSSITSTIFVALITVDRFIVMKYPYGDVRFTPITMVASVTAVWVFGLTAASLPLLPFAQEWVIFSNSGMCLGLPLNNERLPGWQYSAALFVGLNLLLFSFIGIGQFSIYKMLREKGKRTRKNINPQSQLSQSQRMQEFAVARQLSLIVITNFMCWFPIITMGIMALSGNAVGHGAYRWSAALILPVNSALNPVLYTLPALKKKWTEFRDKHQKSKMAQGKEAGTSQTEETNTSVRKPCSKKLLLLRSCRSMAAIRRLLTSDTRHGVFIASGLSELYTRVSAQRAAVRL